MQIATISNGTFLCCKSFQILFTVPIFTLPAHLCPITLYHNWRSLPAAQNDSVRYSHGSLGVVNAFWVYEILAADTSQEQTLLGFQTWVLISLTLLDHHLGRPNGLSYSSCICLVNTYCLKQIKSMSCQEESNVRTVYVHVCTWQIPKAQ